MNTVVLMQTEYRTDYKPICSGPKQVKFLACSTCDVSVEHTLFARKVKHYICMYCMVYGWYRVRGRK